MRLVYAYLFPVMWLSYLTYWWAMSAKVKVTERQEAVGPRLFRSAVITGALVLLGLPKIPLPLLDKRFLRPGLGASGAVRRLRPAVFSSRSGHGVIWGETGAWPSP